eukprot:CAMPEP_0117649814 /NCGR_PEP_ID=MMETSP0804-20121206/1196_1 /TAXON_ID=1074897 /ORGANISM="Tetraselmis astigmatica, Strain CCMP880" /LENGTH=110 /DNA_ID=CAMNT_0005455623 /DNA_START=186 /DNA_END=519 /DNA_ORIENTATION=+
MTITDRRSIYGTRSFRSGIATTPANGGIPTLQWGQHGAWQTLSVQMRYMGTSERQLNVTRPTMLTIGQALPQNLDSFSLSSYNRDNFITQDMSSKECVKVRIRIMYSLER